jgi:8-oxo-dGTP diphosphatase
MKMFVHVAVGVIFDCPADSALSDSALSDSVLPGSILNDSGSDESNRPQKHILIAKRADHQHQGGLWEFPGGKVEAGESVQVALQRELEEELGLVSSLDDMRPLITIPFHYPDKSVLLDVWAVYNAGAFKEALGKESLGKKAIGAEGQPLVWAEQSELANYEFPAANKAIIDALLLPKKIAITQDNNDPDVILRQVANTLRNQANTWIQLRAPRLDQLQFTQLAMKLYGLCHEAGSKLIWNCPLDWYQVAFADGLHLSRCNFKDIQDRPIPTTQWLSAACHNLEELEDTQKRVDYVLVSPVHETTTHPKANTLTWSGFKVITDQARIPCYALGGMQCSELSESAQFGGQGIAGISCFLV